MVININKLILIKNIKILLKKNIIIFSNNDYNIKIYIKKNIIIKKNKNYIKIYTKNNIKDSCIFSFFLLIKQIIYGLNNLYLHFLYIKGLGFKFDYNNSLKLLNLKIGYSHIVNINVNNIKAVNISIIKNNKICLISPLKSELGNFSYYIRSLPKKDLYKGKGIHLSNTLLSLKEGKKK